MHLEQVVTRVNLRVMDIQPNETADLILIQELAAAGILEVELGEAYENDCGGWTWPTPRLIQYPTGRLACFGGE